ncbi:hypothetical protein GQR58_029958 [Nymphon striatum]|nr:hypothetical protein GQR58_029958 [Nymphon striatum]
MINKGEAISGMRNPCSALGRWESSRAIEPPKIFILTVRGRLKPPRLLENLKQPCRAHAATNTHGANHVFRAATLALDQRMTNHPRTGHAIRMSDRNCATVHIQDVVGDAQNITRLDDLNRKGFVQFPQPDVIHRQPMRLEQRRHRIDLDQYPSRPAHSPTPT